MFAREIAQHASIVAKATLFYFTFACLVVFIEQVALELPVLWHPQIEFGSWFWWDMVHHFEYGSFFGALLAIPIGIGTTLDQIATKESSDRPFYYPRFNDLPKLWALTVPRWIIIVGLIALGTYWFLTTQWIDLVREAYRFGGRHGPYRVSMTIFALWGILWLADLCCSLSQKRYRSFAAYLLFTAYYALFAGLAMVRE